MNILGGILTIYVWICAIFMATVFRLSVRPRMFWFLLLSACISGIIALNILFRLKDSS